MELPLALRRETRTNAGKPPVRYGMTMTSQIEFQTLMSHPHTKHSLHLYNQCLFQRIGRLQSWIPGGKKDAMKEELGALQKNKTWDLLPLPAGKRAVGCKWVFTVKQTPEGKVDR